MRKDTDTVNRYRIDYQNALGDEKSLKVEVSYRTPVEKNNVNQVDGFNLVPLENIAQFKIDSVLNNNNTSRTKARDLYDASFILEHHSNLVTYEQLIQLNRINIDALEMRYQTAFDEDDILNKIKDLTSVLLQLTANAEHLYEKRKAEYESKLTYEQKAAVEAWRRVIDERFKGDPAKRQEKHDALDAKIPSIVTGEYKIEAPTIKEEQQIQVQTRDKCSQDRGI